MTLVYAMLIIAAISGVMIVGVFIWGIVVYLTSGLFTLGEREDKSLTAIIEPDLLSDQEYEEYRDKGYI